MKVACGGLGGLVSALGLLGTHFEAGLFVGTFFISGFFLVSNFMGVHEFIHARCPKLKIFVRSLLKKSC